MNKFIISLIFLWGSAAAAVAATTSDLAPGAPDRYVVVKGDTLWAISKRFLNDPWKWPELWKANQDQIKNPNRIYPGDVLVLDRSAEEMRLKLLRSDVVKLGPETRVEGLPPEPIPIRVGVTLRMLVDPATRPADLARPGHIFPLRARPGGVLIRQGHTEASVDLCRLAGLSEVAVISEITNDDGTMARFDQLVEFSRTHGLMMITIADLIRHRRRTEDRKSTRLNSSH